MKNDSTTRAVIYARYSSDRQREESIDAQLRECREYAQRNGIKVIGDYCDYALTGTSDARPQFQRMIVDSAKRQFDIVLVWKIDRFARNRYDSAHYKAILKKHGVRVISAKESIPEGPEGILLEAMIEGYAEYYSANLAQNVKRGMYESALKLKTVGNVVFGLRADADDHYQIDPATAPAVKRIFEEYAAGRPSKDIIADLNAEGYRTPRGYKLSADSIIRAITNKKYMGTYTFEDICVENAIPPIVSKELWEKANAVLNERRKKPAAKKTEGGFLLTGKLYCGHCGAPMGSDAGTGGKGQVYQYYICNNRRAHKCDKKRVNKQWAEDLVVASLMNIIADDNFINEIADAFIAWQDKQDYDATVKALEKRLAKNQKAIKNVLALVDAGKITDSLQQHLYELENEKAELNESIAKEKVKMPTISREEITAFLEQFRDGDVDDYRWRIYLVETFLQKAFLYDDKLILTLNYSGKNNKVTLPLAEEAVKKGKPISSKLPRQGSPNADKLNFCIIYYNKVFAVQIRL